MAGPSTRAVHAGERPDAESGAVNTPTVNSTTYRYPERLDGSPATHIYTRYDNPTTQAVEAKLAALEEADGAFLFASGMAATHAAILAFAPEPGLIAYQQGIYGGTTALFHDVLEPLGYTFHVLDSVNPEIPDAAQLVWMEAITNPLLRVADVSSWAEQSHAVGARLIVDATFATPSLVRPLGKGADLVMHSATKYLNGHSDVTAGVLAFQSADRDAIWNVRRNLGATLDPAAATLLGRGMKTLSIRMERHQQNAATIAAALQQMPDVKHVHYPGLSNHPDHQVADAMDGFGGMVTFDLGTKEAAQSFRRGLKLILPAASLGGVESLASLPLETSHAYASEAQRRKEGILDGLVRLSVGIEDVDDLLADIKGALHGN